jgi:hypothetical protein
MKISLKLLSGIALLALFLLVTTGCPVGVPYPLCEAHQVEQVDSRLIGTWKCLSDSAEILQVRISEEDDITYGVEMLQTGSNYMAEDSLFFSWATQLDGHHFLFSQGIESEDSNFFLYEFSFEGKKLVIHDVGLLVGGMDAITSTEALRAEVAASLKMTGCLSSRFEYEKQ